MAASPVSPAAIRAVILLLPTSLRVLPNRGANTHPSETEPLTPDCPRLALRLAPLLQNFRVVPIMGWKRIVVADNGTPPKRAGRKAAGLQSLSATMAVELPKRPGAHLRRLRAGFG